MVGERTKKMSTYNPLDLETLGSQPSMPESLLQNIDLLFGVDILFTVHLIFPQTKARLVVWDIIGQSHRLLDRILYINCKKIVALSNSNY